MGLKESTIVTCQIIIILMGIRLLFIHTTIILMLRIFENRYSDLLAKYDIILMGFPNLIRILMIP